MYCWPVGSYTLYRVVRWDLTFLSFVGVAEFFHSQGGLKLEINIPPQRIHAKRKGGAYKRRGRNIEQVRYISIVQWSETTTIQLALHHPDSLSVLANLQSMTSLMVTLYITQTYQTVGLPYKLVSPLENAWNGVYLCCLETHIRSTCAVGRHWRVQENEWSKELYCWSEDGIVVTIRYDVIVVWIDLPRFWEIKCVHTVSSPHPPRAWVQC